MIDAVLGYHTNPYTCGVAKFNQRLARELGVPHDGLTMYRGAKHPLLSVKHAEVPLYQIDVPWPEFDVFLHDWVGGPLVERWLPRPTRVYAANRAIADAVRPIRPDVIEAWCPSTIEGNPTRGTINVLTFGMAHKIQTARYEQLKTLLDATGSDYTVSVSTAIHEGSPWDETATVGDKLRSIFGDHLRVLGYLADDALARELGGASAVALFFDPALRANNTTFWAAVDADVPVVTNLDVHSPQDTHAYNIDQITEWPPNMFACLRPLCMTWDGLVSQLQGQPCAK